MFTTISKISSKTIHRGGKNRAERFINLSELHPLPLVRLL